VTNDWPATLWIIRHGESAANLSSHQAEISGALEIPLPTRDMDTPLSPLGETQAAALGVWFSGVKHIRPDIILCSPYLRTRQTLDALIVGWPKDNQPIVRFDERLRERERGIFDGLTKAGVAQRLPEQAAERAFKGKFYHRAPGGESWCDVVQRLRNVVEYILHRHAGKRVAIITHEVVIYCLRYIIEELDEAQILKIDAERDLCNCSVTEYKSDGNAVRLVTWAETASTHTP
jgi:broad specificity phosphatase PhoE